MSAATMAKAGAGKQWFGHPRGLFVLFLTEMWERFSFYGMRALLVLYMTKQLLIGAEQGHTVLGYETMKSIVVWILHATNFPGEATTQVVASQFYGLYTAFVYLTPFFGGILADRVFGQRKSVYIGGFLMAIGHFLMAFESFFFFALLFLILGNGCFKPNISTQVGSLYPQGDPRRDSAFTLFYMGITLGAFFSPFICGTLGETVGWDWGFGAAGVGMLIGLLVYHFGRHELPPDYFDQVHKQHKEKQPLTPAERKRVGALILLAFISCIFWAVYEQQGNTLELWVDQFADRTFFGWTMPASWYQAFNPFFIFVFAPFLDKFWMRQGKNGKEPSTVMKMAIGCFLLGASFLLMMLCAHQMAGGEKTSLMWITGTTLIFTIGELYFSPIGLSLVTKAAPMRMVSMMMGLWFVSSFVGNYMSGWIGGFYDVMSKQGFFSLLMVLGLVSGVIFWALEKPLERMTQSK